MEALVIALFWLTVIFFQNCNTHVLTSFFPELHHQRAFALSYHQMMAEWGLIKQVP